MRSSDAGKTWVIGTSAVQATYTIKDGRFLLPSFQNKLTKPERDYVASASALAPFGVDSQPSAGTFAIETLREKPLVADSTVDLAADNLQMSVKKGDLIGFAARIQADDGVANITWATTVDYGDGETYNSADDTKMDQGPIWYYYIHAPGTGCMELMGEITAATASGEEAREYRAGLRTVRGVKAHGDFFRPVNAYELVRVWKAPKDGKVAIRAPQS